MLSVVSNAESGNCGAEGHESEVTRMLEDGTLTISGTGALKFSKNKLIPE